MASSKKSSVVKQQPLAGAFDARSEPEEIPKDGWRELKNIGVFGINGRLCRAPGWTRLLPSTPYNNADLHDQLLALQIYYDSVEDADDEAIFAYPPNNPYFGDTCGTTAHTRPQGRQAITFLAQTESSASTRRLLAGTQSRLYALNERGGNWRIIGDGFGGEAENPEIRWQHARIGDYVLFTNDYDEPVYWPYDAPPSGCAMQAVKTIPELQEIGVTKARVILEFRGIIILANIEADGERKTNMVRWSGLTAPLEWIEDPGVSVAGHQELDYGEEVLAGGVIGNFAFLYTNRGVWQIAISADPAITFDFRKVYASDVGESCIKYPFTFVSLGDAHIYMAKDAIYSWSQYAPKPERLEWIHRGSQILYENLNESNCAVHTAGFDPTTKQLYFSCATGTDLLPSVTLVCNTEYRQAYKLDHGFTAFAAYVPDDRPSIRDFFVENCLLEADCFTDLEAAGLGALDLKSGTLDEVETECPIVAQHVYTNEPLQSIYPSQPQLDYDTFENFDLVGAYQMDLLGQGLCGDASYGNPLQDLIPGNGLYLRPIVSYNLSQGLALDSKETFAFSPSYKYRLSVRCAGNNVEASSHVTLKAIVYNNDVEETITRAWDDGFVTEEIIFDGVEPAIIELFFQNTDIEGGNYGPLIDRIKLERIDPTTLALHEVMLDDNFNRENESETACFELEDVVTEDYNQAEASGDSFCALVGDQMLKDLCRKCDSAAIFIGASATDWCLKQFGGVYYRERHTGDGEYVSDPYQTRLLKILRGNSEIIALTRLLLQFRSELDATPLEMNLRVGGSARAEDPLQPCGIQWSDEGGRAIDCLNDDKPMEWLLWASQRFLYIDLTIDGVGGASCYSSMELEVQPAC